MSRTRRTFGKDFKAKVVLDTLKEKDTFEVLAKKIRVASQPNFNMEVRGHKECLGFMYLTAIIDLHTIFILNWDKSNTMSTEWCTAVLQETIEKYGDHDI